MKRFKRFLRVTLLMLTIICVMGKSPHLVEAHSWQVNGWTEKIPGYYNVDGTDYVAWFECDKKRSATASALWFTLGYRITLQPIQVGRNIDDYVGFDYYYSTYSNANNDKHAVVTGNSIADAIKKELNGDVHNTNRIDTIHGLTQSTLRERYNALAAQYPHLVYREGTQVYAFLQPIIGVANQKKGGYYAVKHSNGYAQEYRSLGQWKNAKGWANTSTFANHYNKKIPMPVEENVTVSYRMYNAGQAEDGSGYGTETEISSYNAGKVTMGVSKTLGEYGFRSGYNWHSTGMQLVGVRIEQGKERSGSFAERVANNLYYDNTTYGIAKCVGLYNTGAYAGRRVSFSPSYSGFADALGSGTTFNTNTRGDNITIVYLYGQPASKADFYYQALYYGNPKGDSSAGQLQYLDTKPFNSEFNRSMTDKVKSQITGKKINNRVGKPVDTIYMPFQLDLTEGSLTNSNSRLVGNSVWGGAGIKDLSPPVLGQYDASGSCTSKNNLSLFGNAVNSNANARFVSKGQNKQYVFTAKYRSVSPVVSLKYFRDLNGNLTLFSVGTPDTAGNIRELPKNETTDVTNLRYSIYGDAGSKAVANVEKYLGSKNVSFDASSRTANMHLVESYVVDLDSSTSINGWGGATSNCWDKGELVRGAEYKSDGNGITGTMQATTERRNEAMNEVSGSHTMTAVASGQPMAMVFIYEEAPEVMVRSFVTSQHERDIDKLYNLYGVKESEVTLQGKTYKRSM